MERKITEVLKSRPTLEGAGVRLKRAFGYHELPRMDPFLLLDDFHSQNPDDYIRGFPWHPHRGIETVTYILKGAVEHGDSMGNEGIIREGDVQWMTAGSGIVHQEMPKEMPELWGFQLWVNLPAANKMCKPRYRGILANEIPEVEIPEGVKIKVVSGEFGGKKGPVEGLFVDVEYFDVSVEAGVTYSFEAKAGHRLLLYTLEGEGEIATEGKSIKNEHLVILGGEEIENVPSVVRVKAGEEGFRFLWISGMPLKEKIAWAGPIVMNTREEISLAFREYDEGTFIKHEDLR